jgi:hypothetical protein
MFDAEMKMQDAKTAAALGGGMEGIRGAQMSREQGQADTGTLMNLLNLI